jgi:hypothetical protein
MQFIIFSKKIIADFKVFIIIITIKFIYKRIIKQLYFYLYYIYISF